MPAMSQHRAASASAGGTRRRASGGQRAPSRLHIASGSCFRQTSVERRASVEEGHLRRLPKRQRRRSPAVLASSAQPRSPLRVRALRAAAAAAGATERSALTAASAVTRLTRAARQQLSGQQEAIPAAAEATEAPRNVSVGSVSPAPVGRARRRGLPAVAAQTACTPAAGAEADSSSQVSGRRGASALLPRRQRRLRGAEALRCKFACFAATDLELSDALCGCCLDGLLPTEEPEATLGVATSDGPTGQGAAAAGCSQLSKGASGVAHLASQKAPPPPLARIDACAHCFHLRCIQVWAQRETTCPLCKAVFSYIAAYNGATRELLDVQKCVHVFQKDLPSSSESVVSVETVSSGCSSSELSEREESQQQQQQRGHRVRRVVGSDAGNGDESEAGMARLVRRVLESWGRTVSSLRRSRTAGGAAAGHGAAAVAAAAGTGLSSHRQRVLLPDRDEKPEEGPPCRQWRRGGGGPAGGRPGPTARIGRGERAAEASPSSEASRTHRRRRREEPEEETANKRPTAAPSEVARRTASFFQRRVDALYPPEENELPQERRGAAAAAAASPCRLRDRRGRQAEAAQPSDALHADSRAAVSSSGAAAAAAARRAGLAPVIVPLASMRGIGGAGGAQRRRGLSSAAFNLRPNYADDFLVSTGNAISCRQDTAAAGKAV